MLFGFSYKAFYILIVDFVITVTLAGITQEQINKARSTRENRIVKDAQEFVAAGNDINVKDHVGATLVSSTVNCLGLAPVEVAFDRVALLPLGP